MNTKFAKFVSAVIVAVALSTFIQKSPGFTTTVPTPIINYQASSYVGGSTTWTNSGSNGATGNGSTAAGGIAKSGPGVAFLQFAGKESSDSDRVTGTIGSTASLSSVSVEMWVRLKDDGSTQNQFGSMLFSWASSPYYNVYHYANGFGFNTFSSEMYGINAASFVNQWKHVVFVMVKNGTAAQQEIYVNGVKQTASCNPTWSSTAQCDSSAVNLRREFDANGNFILMDVGSASNTWNARSDLGMVRIYGTALTDSEVNAAFIESQSNGYIDTVGPTVTAVSAPSTPTANRNLTYTYSFSENVSGVSSSDFANGGTATGCSFTPASSSGTSIQVAVSCTSDGTVIAQLSANSITDIAMNTGPPTTHSATTVTISASVTSTSSSSSSTSSSSTTVAPSSTTTVANSSTSTTQPRTSTTSSSTSTLPVPGESSVPPTVEATTTTISPSTTVEQLSVIDIPELGDDAAVMQIDGKKVPIEITRRNNELKVSTPALSMVVKMLSSDGSVTSLSSDGGVAGFPGDSFNVGGEGLEPRSTLEVRMYSEPTLLGRTAVAKDGTVSGSYEIPQDAEAGRHVLVLLGRSASGEEVNFFYPVDVKSTDDGPGVLPLLILIPVLIAVGLGFIVPPALRRRRSHRG
jgi:hypothetical protein